MNSMKKKGDDCMRKHHIRIIGIGIFLFVAFMMIPFSVIAEEVSEATFELAETEGEKNVTDNQSVLNNKNIKDECKDFIRTWKVSPSMFGITMEYDGDNDLFTLEMEVPGGYRGANKENIKFRIEKIEILEIPKKETDPKVVKQTFRDLEAVYKIPSSTRLTNLKKITFPNNQEYPARYRIYLVADGFQDSFLKSACGSRVKYSIYKEYDFYGKVIRKDVSYEREIEENPELLGEIKCDGSKTYLPNSFEDLFCKDWKAAGGDRNAIDFREQNTYEKRFGSDAAETFSCDPFTLVKKPDISKPDYYLENHTKYLHGTTTYTIQEDDYVYNYGGQKKDGSSYNSKLMETQTASCEVTCKEVVTTKYGPPVASKAGLCFEYKVEVTSRVNCYMSQPPQRPKNVTIEDGKFKIKGSYCTPSPGCDHGSGYVDAAAGPSEDFDACVSSCDGGKYTSSCSKKCYKEVYGKKTTSKKTSYFDMNDMPAPIALWDNNTLDRAMEKNGIGQYLNIGGTIIWRPASHLGRWYVEKNYITGQKCLKTEAEGGGISAVCGCWAKCRWNGCTGKVYLNPYSVTVGGKTYTTTYSDGTTPVATELDNQKVGELERDALKNIQKYQNVISRCQSQSKCSTTKATFSISVNYNNGTQEGKTIYFPYTPNNDSNAKDSIQRNPETGLVSCTKGTNQYTTILSSKGCYNCNSKATVATDTKATSAKWYQTEWGFPGTWIHNKTGEISYEPKGTGWTEQKNKFCLPLNAQNVNVKWWNYYQTKLFGHETDDGVQYSYNNADYIRSIKECRETAADNILEQQKTATKFTGRDAAGIKYNIHAKTRKFGLFEWNIDVKCFYAINNIYLAEDEKNVSKTSDDIKDILNCMGGDAAQKKEMRIRSVDLENLFPEPGGKSLTNSTQTGRTPGFNWSQYATNMKISNYPSQPSEYIRWVQKKGYEVYNDKYLDYEISINRKQIREIQTMGEDYARYEGRTEIGDVTHYVSTQLLRKLLRDGSKLPNEIALKCNNMKNYQSNECAESGTGGVE